MTAHAQVQLLMQNSHDKALPCPWEKRLMPCVLYVLANVGTAG
jgi:hypothetical protein